jgi:hypothetical protein
MGVVYEPCAAIKQRKERAVPWVRLRMVQGEPAMRRSSTFDGGRDGIGTWIASGRDARDA